MDNAKNDIVFQMFDITSCENLHTIQGSYDISRFNHDDTYNEESFSDDSPPKQKNTTAITNTTICLFGKTDQGENVLARVRFCPYIYVEVPPQWKEQEFQQLILYLEQFQRLSRGTLFYEREIRKRSYGWIPDPKDASKTARYAVLKLHCPNETMMRYICNCLKSEKQIERMYKLKLSRPFKVWEHNISTIHKFCDEQNICPTEWVKIESCCYSVATNFACSSKTLEIIVPDSRKVIVMNEIRIMAPFVTASFDIECFSKSRVFPKAENDDDVIIGIGTVVQHHGGSVNNQRVYYALHDTVIESKDTGIVVRYFHSELDMILAWRDWLILEVNPDILIGYNINFFDIQYLTERVNKLFSYGGTSRFFYQSRLWAELTVAESSDFSSKAYGDRKMYTFCLSGRLVADLLEIIRRDPKYKFRSYKLDNVASTLLGQNKYDLPPQQLFQYFETDAQHRGIIAEYCIKDCDLVLDIASKMTTILNIMGMAKVTITPVQSIVTKGQQVKVLNQIVWYGHRMGFVINESKDIRLKYLCPEHGDFKDLIPKPKYREKGEKEETKSEACPKCHKVPEVIYQGATVLEPKAGYYSDPIAVLDFASLYPSIMISKNLCFSTWVNEERYQNLTGPVYDNIDVGPRQHMFVTHVEGIIPRILRTLLEERGKVKLLMEQEQDPLRKSVLDSTQNALKISANSVYGFTGTQEKGKYGCLAVSETTTWYGRQMISTLKQKIETDYPGTIVVYGDTDSVMVLFHLPPECKEPVLKSFEYGKQVGDMASKLFGGVIKLTMEKVFHGYILLRKKRYAGLAYTGPTEKPKVKQSGLESVRRDFAPFLSTLYSEVVNILLKERDVNKAVQCVQKKVQQLAEDKIPFEEYILSRELKGSYKNQNTTQQVIVNKMKERCPGSEPKSGERVQFVIIETKSQNAPMYQKAEDAEYAKEHKLKLDRIYYLEKQLERPLTDLLKTFIEHPEHLFVEPRAIMNRQRLRLKNIQDFFTPAPSAASASASSSTPLASSTKQPMTMSTKAHSQNTLKNLFVVKK